MSHTSRVSDFRHVFPSSIETDSTSTPRTDCALPDLGSWLWTISSLPSCSFTASRPVLGTARPAIGYALLLCGAEVKNKGSEE